MRDHGIEVEGTERRVPSRREQGQEPPGGEIGRALAATRPDTLGASGLAHLQRAAGNAGVNALLRTADEGTDHDDSPVHDVIARPGEPLDRETRSTMEDRLGHDFSDVRVHTDPAAAASARAVQAHAYTVGNHVVFGEGRYRPDSDEGRHTLAHELTHVTQQRQGPVDGTPAAGGIKVSHPDDRFEREAERAATDALAPGAGSSPAPEPQVTPSLQREGADDVTGPAAVQREAEEQEEEPAEAAVAEAPEEQTDEDVPVSTLAVQRQEDEELEQPE
jgi:hypothetical protein